MWGLRPPSLNSHQLYRSCPVLYTALLYTALEGKLKGLGYLDSRARAV